MLQLSSVCVYCGSHPGHRPEFREATEDLARRLASEGIGIVYGGGNVGLMGALADAALEAGGKVTGVIPESLIEREVAHRSLTELHVVSSMHRRKALMAELSDAFVALPGGLGTLEEMVEMATWGQLGFHRKPCALLDVCGYYGPLRELLQRMVAEGFLEKRHRDLLVVEKDPAELLHRLGSYRHPPERRWPMGEPGEGP